MALLAAVLPAAATGCATPGGHQLQTDLDTIQQQLWKIQKDNVALAEQVARLREPSPGSGSQDTTAADLRLRLETLERDVQALHTRAEETEERLGEVTRELRVTRQALDALARAVPPAGVSPPPAPALRADEPTASRVPEAAGSLQGQTGTGAPHDLFRQASSDFSSGNYELAIQELTDLVKRYPASDVTDDALYLMGEAHFSQQHYPEAITAFDQLLKAYPDGDRAPAAHLKKGLALLEMNRTADAVIQLQHIVTAYPRTEEARIARERLRALGLKER
jgi:tol-pal system protein YbgF